LRHIVQAILSVLSDVGGDYMARRRRASLESEYGTDRLKRLSHLVPYSDSNRSLFGDNG